MEIETTFLDWNAPALPAAVDQLIQLYQSDDVIDLSHVLTVFPGSQAGRRFLELLAEKTNGRASPPRILTVGTLPEFLYELKKAFASSLTQNLAWSEALRAIPRDRLEIVIPQPPDEMDVDAWLNLGELIRRQHRELATDRLDFAEVASKGESLEGFNEQERWKVLAEVQTAYWKILDDQELWDQQSARLFALDQDECTTDADIVMIGTVDLNKSLRAMLEQVASKQTQRVRIFVHAPQSEAHLFEKLGNLKPSAWENLTLEIEDQQIQIVDGPQEQAAQIAIELSHLSGKYASEDIAVCLPDDRIIPHVSRLLELQGVSTNWVIEQTLPESAPFQLLECVASYLDADRTDHFSELIRHPDFAEWINRQDLPANWLTRWDANVAEHLQRRTAKILGNSHSAKTARKLVETVRLALKPFRGAAKPLADWSSPLRDFLLKIYGEVDFNPDIDDHRLIIQATQMIHNACLEHGKIPEALAPVVSASQAIKMTLSQIRGEFLSSTAKEDAIHLSGWLDMPLDDAPVALITSMNEGFVPSAVNHDLFLPNRLRTHLEIEDNARRYARDAYALSVVLHSREHVRLIAAKRDVRKEPLTPSRLLFATHPQKIAERVVKFFDEDHFSKPQVIGISTNRDESDFNIPRPAAMEEPKRSFRVTEFKDYITSPYRYYLRNVLGLGEVYDQVVELDPAGFGSLIHDVLQRFGLSDQANQTDPLQISKYLNQQLDELVEHRYGSDPLFPVFIQVEQIRHRLNIFAEWQASWVRQGYEIRFTEIGFRRNAQLDMLDGTSITLRGRIDRVDYNKARDEWVIFDYKTSDRGSSPDQTHRKQNEWVDLQLPLYRHLAKPFGVEGNVRLGYITLPRTTTQIREQIADWSESDLLEADERTREIAGSIIREEFWVELDQPVRWFQEFSGICQDGVFDREAIL